MYYDTFGRGRGAEWATASHRVELYDVQQSALFVSESLALEALANVTGNVVLCPRLRKQRIAMSAAINRVLWDDGTGIYRQVDASPARRGFSPVISPTSFYPMIAGVATADQALRMVRDHLTNASEFGVEGTVVRAKGSDGFMPSISRADPSYGDNDYWRGRSWGPLHLLVWLGLSSPAYANWCACYRVERGPAETERAHA